MGQIQAAAKFDSNTDKCFIINAADKVCCSDTKQERCHIWAYMIVGKSFDRMFLTKIANNEDKNDCKIIIYDNSEDNFSVSHELDNIISINNNYESEKEKKNYL